MPESGMADEDNNAVVSLDLESEKNNNFNYGMYQNGEYINWVRRVSTVGPSTVKEVPRAWLNRMIPYTDHMKSSGWQRGFTRLFFIDDHGVFRPLDLQRAQAGEMTHFRQIDGLPYNVGEILHQFTTLPLSHIHHYANMGIYLNELYLRKKLVDALVHVGDQVFAAHRMVLACHSVYFARAFLANKHQNRKMAELRLWHVDNIAFRDILHFIYTGRLYVTNDNVDVLMHVAQELQLSAVLFKCLDFLGQMPLCRNIDVIGQPTTQALEDQVRRLLSAPLSDASNSQAFLRMGIESVEMALGQDDVMISTEMEVLDAAMKWLDYDRRARRKYLERLMRQVRFTCMTASEVIQASQSHSLMCTSPYCRNRVMESIWLLTLRSYRTYDTLDCDVHRHRTFLTDPSIWTAQQTDPEQMSPQQTSPLEYENLLFDNTPQEPQRDYDADVQKEQNKHGFGASALGDAPVDNFMEQSIGHPVLAK